MFKVGDRVKIKASCKYAGGEFAGRIGKIVKIDHSTLGGRNPYGVDIKKVKGLRDSPFLHPAWFSESEIERA